MDDLFRLWATALLLGLWIGGSRVVSQLPRFPTTASKIGAVMLSLTIAILVLLYSWEPLRARPSMLLFAGGLAAWFGPEAPEIASTILRAWMRAYFGGNGNGDKSK